MLSIYAILLKPIMFLPNFIIYFNYMIGIYSGDPNREHLNSGNIWIMNFYLFAIQMPANCLLFKTVRCSEGNWNLTKINWMNNNWVSVFKRVYLVTEDNMYCNCHTPLAYGVSLGQTPAEVNKWSVSFWTINLYQFNEGR